MGIKVFFDGAFPSMGPTVWAFIQVPLQEFARQHTRYGGQGH